jgi:hypothetical protein
MQEKFTWVSADGRKKQDLIKWLSPVAWQYINLLGNMSFFKKTSIYDIFRSLLILSPERPLFILAGFIVFFMCFYIVARLSFTLTIF